MTRSANHAAVAVIGVPLDLGAGRRGVDMGPAAIRLAGLGARLAALGYDVEDEGDLRVPPPEARNPGDPRAKYLREIREVCAQLRDRVCAAQGRGQRTVVLGGDHSIAMGTIAGLARFHHDHGERIGVVWIDAHADCNTPSTSPSGNVHGMPLAAALGLGALDLVELAGFRPMVSGERTALVGIRDVDAAERDNVVATGLRAFTMREIDERGVRAVMAAAIEHAARGAAGLHVSIDADGMDPSYAPGVGTPSPGGLTYREAHLAMEMLADSGKVVSAEFAEVNPVLDRGNETAELAVGLLASLFGKRIL